MTTAERSWAKLRSKVVSRRASSAAGAKRDAHASGKSVVGGRVDQLAGLLKVLVLVDEGGENGAKDLLDHGDRLGVLGHDDGRLNVEPSRVVSCNRVVSETASAAKEESDEPVPPQMTSPPAALALATYPRTLSYENWELQCDL